MTSQPTPGLLADKSWRIVSLCGIVIGLADICYSLLLKRSEPWNVHLPIAHSYDHHLLPLSLIVLGVSIVMARTRSINIRLRASMAWSGCFLIMRLRYIYAFPARIDFSGISMLAALIAALSLSDWLISVFSASSKAK